MTEPAGETAPESVRLGVFHYMQPSAESSLYRNGRVLTRRDRDGSDSDRLGVDLEERDMPILDARGLRASGTAHTRRQRVRVAPATDGRPGPGLPRP